MVKSRKWSHFHYLILLRFSNILYAYYPSCSFCERLMTAFPHFQFVCFSFHSPRVLCIEILLSEIPCTYYFLVCYLSFTFAWCPYCTDTFNSYAIWSVILLLCDFYIMCLLQKGIYRSKKILKICYLFFSFLFMCLTFVSLIHVELRFFKEQGSDLTCCFSWMITYFHNIIY